VVHSHRKHRHMLERTEQTLLMVDMPICKPSCVTRDGMVDAGNDAPHQPTISVRTGRRCSLLALGTPSSRELSLVETGRPIRPFLRPDCEDPMGLRRMVAVRHCYSVSYTHSGDVEPKMTQTRADTAEN
jgi:hypothetical protein